MTTPTEMANSRDPTTTGVKTETEQSLNTRAQPPAQLPSAEHPHDSPEPEEEIDYSKIYDALQERFNKVYSISQKLFVTEKTQRQTMYHYKRRNDAILDLLNELEDDEEISDEPLSIDEDKISQIIAAKPDLADVLDPVMKIASGQDPATIKVKDSYNVDLAVIEAIPDMVNDELDTVEVNPQDTEMWTRRNYAHLVLSKFKPVEIRGKGVREYINSPTLNTKRKKKGLAKE
ncbi:CIC11C00000001448 [Sungouiella intermedia]|uniref:CIC11C00000001448 n=1 Tax=Sungouiella intermedia TaxID=45354 RepID=A0A1L0DJJ1_9ASCO|nr:CIC11C00000001448 [[Candida] intermedia]